MITIPKSDLFPEIDWEIGDQLDYDPDERMNTYIANGTDKYNIAYTGTAYFFAGEFDSVKDIEKL
jgi:hypothetical protein